MTFFQILANKSSSSTKIRSQSTALFSAIISRSFSRSPSSSQRPSFGIAFDIDGVLLRGDAPIGGSPRALRRLYDDSTGTLKVPYIFLTNGGGVPESKRALELEKQLGVNILSTQVIQGHTPFKQLVNRFEKELVIAVGKGEPALVMSEYGFKNVLSIDDYASCFDNIDPLARFKKWTTGNISDRINTIRSSVCSQRVQAAFVVSDPVDWSRDIQVLPLNLVDLRNESLRVHSFFYFLFSESYKTLVQYHKDEVWSNCGKSVPSELNKRFEHVPRSSTNYSVSYDGGILVLCDILRTGGLPGSKIAHQPPLYFANDDLEYQAVFPSERLGMGAFRIALESIFNRIHPNALEYTSFGKPNPSVFRNAETVLRELVHLSSNNVQSANHQIGRNYLFRTLYMVGDNPSVDIKGAQQAGHPWYSILTRTGVFKGKENHEEYPADLVVDTVEEAVDFILRKEGI